MAAALPVATFHPENCEAVERALRELAAYPKEARHIPRVMSEFGIRFVVVEPLPGTRVDGAAFWLDESSPAIAVSLRIDRVDSIWFTILHEWTHIRNNDTLSVDTNLIDDDDQAPALIEEESERRANRHASDILVPEEELESFIRRVGPLYSKERIVQFAHRMRIHPGIIVGQLHHRKEIGYSANREMLAKLRSVVIETALTDGWGRMITPGVL
jgi:HTH-type transcriptional regulator/antitoxin HigA